MAKNKGKKAKDELDIEDIELDDEQPSKGKNKKSKQEAPAADKGGKKGKTEAAPAEKAKRTPPSREPLSDDYTTAEHLAEEYGINPRDVRQTLRDAEVEKPAIGRWAWHQKKEASMLKQVRSLLNGRGTRKAKTEAPAEAPAKGKKGKESEAPAEEGKKGKKKNK